MATEQARRTHPLVNLWRLHPFRLHISVLFSALVLVVGAVLVWSNYVQGRRIVLSAAADVFERISREVEQEMTLLAAPAEAVVDAMSRSPVTDAASFESRTQVLPGLADALKRHPVLQSIYVGYYNGDYFQLLALRTDADRNKFQAPRHAAYRLQSIDRGTHRVRLQLLDAALNTVRELPVPSDYSYDPRQRPWYVQALRSTELIETAPYLFFTSRDVGQTVARRAEHGRAVVGADMTLGKLSEFLRLARPTPSSVLAVVDSKGGVIAHSDRPPSVDDVAGPDAQLPRASELFPVLGAAGHDAPPAGKTVQHDGREWLVRFTPASNNANGMTYLGVATPSDELLTAAREALRRNVWLALVLVLLTAPLVGWIARRIASNLNSLIAQAAAIRRFDFAPSAPVDSRIIEINDLDLAMGGMRDTIRKFIDITTALSGERKLDRLLRRVLDEARDAAGAQGGVVYLVDHDSGTLKPADQTWGPGAAGGTLELPDIALEDEAHPIVEAVRASASPTVRVLPLTRPAGLEFLDARFPGRPAVLASVPLPDRAGKVIGVLCVFSDGTREVPSPERLALVEAFAGAAAVAIDNQRLIAAQKALFDALIGLIGVAIDAKSQYTAGHCQRVPELTNMLTRAACDAKSGPFAEFDLDENGWEALHIAGGLHDCGKVTTPEYVVDKATKLETLYDRIHEIRMRFEVLKRDAEIRCLKAVAAGGDEQALEEGLQTELRALDDDFEFVAACNLGGEFMAPEKLERLSAIAGRTWQRTLDDRLGVSWEEAERMAKRPAQALPATERLLADKPEHVIERRASELAGADNPWGFRLKVPAALYDRGELHNLSIARGTLTDEERYKINDHITQTIVMLSGLPFPAHLKAVPELAGGHHEKMDGSGYPRGLRREQMSVPARAMAIADIFEALTAADRPYKKAKKLSEAVRIMGFMKKDRHIDPDLFDLFLASGVYRRYAETFMPPEYIDEVDISAYVGA